MDDAATTVDAATSCSVDGAPSASATAPTAAAESTQGVASASSAAPSAASDGAAPMAPPGATPSTPTSDATTPLSSDASTPASATASTPAAAANSAASAGDPDDATDDLLRHGLSLLQPIEVMEASLKSSKARTAEDATAGADDADDADAKGPPNSDAPFRCPLEARHHNADAHAPKRLGFGMPAPRETMWSSAAQLSRRFPKNSFRPLLRPRSNRGRVRVRGEILVSENRVASCTPPFWTFPEVGSGRAQHRHLRTTR